MSTADILAKLMQKKQERAKLDSQIYELESQFYLSLLNDQPQQVVNVQEHRPDQKRVAGIVCRCGDPVKIKQNYNDTGLDYYCCPNPKSTGCDYWVKAAEVAMAGR